MKLFKERKQGEVVRWGFSWEKIGAGNVPGSTNPILRWVLWAYFGIIRIRFEFIHPWTRQTIMMQDEWTFEIRHPWWLAISGIPNHDLIHFLTGKLKKSPSRGITAHLLFWFYYSILKREPEQWLVATPPHWFHEQRILDSMVDDSLGLKPVDFLKDGTAWRVKA